MRVKLIILLLFCCFFLFTDAFDMPHASTPNFADPLGYNRNDQLYGNNDIGSFGGANASESASNHGFGFGSESLGNNNFGQ